MITNKKIKQIKLIFIHNSLPPITTTTTTIVVIVFVYAAASDDFLSAEGVPAVGGCSTGLDSGIPDGAWTHHVTEH